jgi:hypothetical protein
MPIGVEGRHRHRSRRETDLEEPPFMQAFTRKGRFKNLMFRIPMHVITTRAGLVGAATYGLESLNNHQEYGTPRTAD